MSDNPILKENERAILYFSKHGHAPYMQVRSNIGWLRKTLDKTITGYAIADFLEVMSEVEDYVQLSDYNIIENCEPPVTSRAMQGVNILGRKFFVKFYKKPKN